MGSRATRLRALRHAAPRIRRAARPASSSTASRRLPVGSERVAGRRRQLTSSASVHPHSSAVASSPIDSASTGYGAAPPRSAKPPLRPRPAGDLASLEEAHLHDGSASASAHEQPVMPPPMTATSAPSSRSACGSRLGGLVEPVRGRLHGPDPRRPRDRPRPRRPAQRAPAPSAPPPLRPDRGRTPRTSSSAVSAASRRCSMSAAAIGPSAAWECRVGLEPRRAPGRRRRA